MNTTVTISPEDARTGAAFAALLADGDLDAALALHDDPVTLAATMILGQHLEAYVEALSSGHHSIAWPVIAHELRGTIATISERETNSSHPGGNSAEKPTPVHGFGRSLSPNDANREGE